MDKQRIIDMYKLYGFELAEQQDEYLVFTYTNGYFTNAEIVCLKDRDFSREKGIYEQVGYSVSVISYLEISTIAERLFTGFFSLKQTKIKNKKEYVQYCDKQKDKLCCNDYEYLNGEYLVGSSVLSDSLIDRIFDKLTGKGAQLIILEAAAGYGKTCTSYEVLNRFCQESIKKVPLMTELSRNRTASIFKYVLLTEIDRRFSTLSTSVVEYEIKKGNVPLIIDGFDELLSKSLEHDAYDDSFEEVQSMLDTIAQLLEGESQAKVLITSRKSAIFTGEQFDEWFENRALSCELTRIEIRPPRVKDWLGIEKTEALIEKQINLECIANPILLSILRDKELEYIKNHTVTEIIDEYFSTILTREQERQSIPLEVNEQLDILYKLAGLFASYNISAEDREFVKDLIKDIVSDNIDEYISRYTKYSFETIENIPDEDEFVVKLLQHALLDRTVPGKNQIGFINDFVFGYFLGQALCKGYIENEKEIDYKYIDLICTTYSIDGIRDRDSIKSILRDMMGDFSVAQRLEVSNKIFHCISENYCNETITNVIFSKGFEFSREYTIKNSIFVECIFDESVCYDSSFYECHFYNCVFINIKAVKEKSLENTLIFLGCSGHEELNGILESPGVQRVEANKQNFERIVLEQFWKIGSDNPEARRSFTTIYKGIPNKDIVNIDNALTSLLQKGILTKRKVCFELNFHKMREIKEILGRHVQ